MVMAGKDSTCPRLYLRIVCVKDTSLCRCFGTIRYLILAGPALFRGRLRAFGKCTNGVAFSKGRPNLAGVRLTR